MTITIDFYRRATEHDGRSVGHRTARDVVQNVDWRRVGQ
jgi:hypothetical protein